jgi:hypothetical protein
LFADIWVLRFLLDRSCYWCCCVVPCPMSRDVIWPNRGALLEVVLHPRPTPTITDNMMLCARKELIHL